MATAEDLAAQFAIEHAFDDYQALIVHPDVDLVVVPAPAPEHARLVKAAIAGRQGRLQRMAPHHEHR
jgi:predicted dehydrogenase